MFDDFCFSQCKTEPIRELGADDIPESVCVTFDSSINGSSGSQKLAKKRVNKNYVNKKISILKICYV